MMTIWGSPPPPSVFIISERGLLKTSTPEWLLTFSEPPRFHPQPVFSAYFWLVSLLLKTDFFPFPWLSWSISLSTLSQTSLSPCPTSETHPWEPQVFLSGLWIFLTATQQDTDQMFHSIFQPQRLSLKELLIHSLLFSQRKHTPPGARSFCLPLIKQNGDQARPACSWPGVLPGAVALLSALLPVKLYASPRAWGQCVNCHVVILTSRGWLSFT